MHRTNRVALVCAIVTSVAASAAVGQQSDGTPPAPAITATPAPVSPATPTPVEVPVPSATPTPAQAGGTVRYPSLPGGGVDADLSRSLGSFPTVEAAIAAAKAAGLPPGAYGVATLPGELLAIDAAGNVFHLGYMGGSGSPQRPPKDPSGK